MARTIVREIGGFSLSVTVPEFPAGLWLDPRFEQFAQQGLDQDPDIQLTAHFGSMPDLIGVDSRLLFDADGVWRLYHVGGGLAIVIPGAQDTPYSVALLQSDLRQGQIFVRHADDGTPAVDPLLFPLTEVLMVCLLSQFDGLMVHACGIADGGKGYLFAGKSTNGKSTMAGLWRDQARILSDERIIIRRRNGRFWIFGTPWHGELNLFSPHGVPLDKLFILEHGRANRAVPEEPGLGLSELLARSYLPFWDADWMGQVLGFARDLVADIPPRTLAFVPNQEIVEFVRDL